MREYCTGCRIALEEWEWCGRGYCEACEAFKTMKGEIMEMENVRTEKEINEVLDFASNGERNGTKFPGMSYEEGVRAAIDWIFGDLDDRPDAE